MDSSDQPALDVLYADDVPANRRYIKALLDKLGLHTTLAEDGNEAIRIWRQKRQPLVLLDVNMPGMNGDAVARLIRQEVTDEEQVTILGITADLHETLRAELQAAGMDDCILKPTDGQGLGEALGPWLVGTPQTGRLIKPEANPLHQDTALMQQLMQELPADMARLEAAITSQDRVQARQITHQLGGIAALYQLRQLSQALQKLDTQLKSDIPLSAAMLESASNAMAEDLLTIQTG